MRSMRVPALVLGVLLAASAGGVAWQQMRVASEAAGAQNTELRTAAAGTQTRLSEQFEKAAAVGLLLSQDAQYADFFARPGSTQSKIDRDILLRAKLTDQLQYVQTLFPGAVARSGFVDLRSGQEIAEVVNGQVTTPLTLESNADKKLPFAASVESLPAGYVYQSMPYFSQETNQWVIANASGVSVAGKPVGLVYFETSLDSMRTLLLEREGDAVIRAVTERDGLVTIDSRTSQVSKSDFGNSGDTTFSDQIRTFDASGLVTLGGERVAYVRMQPSKTLQAVNDNDWFLTASAPVVVVGLPVAVQPLVLALLALALPLLTYAAISYYRLGRRNRSNRAAMSRERDKLSARLNDMTLALDRAASGDLAVRLPVDFDDEQMTMLASSFENTLDRLRGLVAQAQEHGVQLSQAAEQLKATASEQASSATEQSAVVTQTTATIEELAATAAQISETAQSVSRVAQETLSLTDDGRGAVGDAVSAMESITATVDEIATSSAGLGDKIVEVGRILEMIDELSEQTNLLALNAAIEAARAGEHGRGFAVVAAEVRKLAERAQHSTGQIQSIVTEIQAHARSTVLASEAGAREATRGAAMASGAVVALDRIASMVDEATTAADEISIATQQQRSASDQVVVAMTQVSEVSRQYAAGSRQTEAASTEISMLAAAMQESISTFNVERVDQQPGVADGLQKSELAGDADRLPEDDLSSSNNAAVDLPVS
jgi:methyl-accepting chemotaxis protein